jgi:three-Cys-motif partner protein
MAEITAEDDGLPCSDVGAWAEDKYTLVALYDSLFSTGMKNKWSTRVYIELYAGPGFARVKGTNRMMIGSPLLALAVPDRFDKYIFCESDAALLRALEKRVSRLFPEAIARFVLGDCNEKIDAACANIPSPSKDHGVLSFCFVDPYDVSIRFATVRRLSSFYMDFLFLLALHMDANRNLEHYLNPSNSKIEEFLGLPDWRERWRIAEGQGIKFPWYLAEEYAGQMETLGYLPAPWDKMKPVRSDERNLPLYRLALFSRHPLAYEYWDEVLRYSSNQRTLFEG